ncbi:MAG: (2Fe-2S)-binding protein, partial [Candidatus Dormibacteraeota bacterium]|nr:(2Fe-2S)-binding protein [Candidatus Dormibacteraeota bacterium]
SDKADDAPEGTFRYYALKDRAPRYAVLDTPYGSMYGAYRPGRPGQQYWRIAHFLFPFYTMPPTGLLGRKMTGRAWVPIDDTHSILYSLSYNPDISRDARQQRPAGGVPSMRLKPNTTGWYGRFQMVANEGNDYLMDRERQERDEEYSGIDGIHLQDQAITESMGTIYDRSKEHLGSSDAMVIRVRRRLIAAARALRENGEVPPGVDHPEVYQQRSGGVFIDEGADWVKATEELRKAYVDHPELDPSVIGGFV